MQRTYSILFGLLFCMTAMAEPVAIAPEHEQRYHSLLDELRCLVCQNQTIAESNADLAKDLRNEVRMPLYKGATDSEIIKFMVDRYGDFVLYRPPVKPRTYLLWFGPFVFLVIAFLVLALVLRKQRKPAYVPLTEDEQLKLKSIQNQVEE